MLLWELCTGLVEVLLKRSKRQILHHYLEVARQSGKREELEKSIFALGTKISLEGVKEAVGHVEIPQDRIGFAVERANGIFPFNILHILLAWSGCVGPLSYAARMSGKQVKERLAYVASCLIGWHQWKSCGFPKKNN